MNDRRSRIMGIVIVAALMVTGVVAAGYVLLHERAPVPFRDTFDVRVEVSAADGIQPGLGQPVRVAGVTVGTIADLDVRHHTAVLTLRIERDQLPRVHANARVRLHPITPLEDMQVLLVPGGAPAPALRDGATLPVSRTTTPVPLSHLVSTLDADTRTFLTSLLASLHEGTARRGPDLRRALRALGPTTRQLHLISEAMSSRRTALAKLVHNLGLVTRAASADRDLGDLIAGSHRTLQAVARQERPLREAVSRMPGALRTTGAALDETGRFARELQPALTALRPAVRRLPRALGTLGGFSTTASAELEKTIRPFVRATTPAVRALAPAVTALRDQSPELRTWLKGLNYTFNELAYNPPGKKLGFDDEGFLFWLPWFTHNYNSAFSAKDAHGGGARGMVMVSCQQLASLAGLEEIFRVLIPTYSLCPER